MNDKEKLIYAIIDNVVKCSGLTRQDGSLSITREEVLSPSRKENIVMTRCIVVEQLIHGGFSVTTIAEILNRTVPAIRHLMKMATDYYETSRAYRLATSQATLLNKDVEPIFL